MLHADTTRKVTFRGLNARLEKLLSDGGAKLDAVYYCPHLEDGTVKEFSFACNCRKPEIGLIEQAFKEHSELDRQRSFVVGDKSTDVGLAPNCGSKGVLRRFRLQSSRFEGRVFDGPVKPDFQATSIVEAVEWILSQLKTAV